MKNNLPFKRILASTMLITAIVAMTACNDDGGGGTVVTEPPVTGCTVDEDCATSSDPTRYCEVGPAPRICKSDNSPTTTTITIDRSNMSQIYHTIREVENELTRLASFGFSNILGRNLIENVAPILCRPGLTGTISLIKTQSQGSSGIANEQYSISPPCDISGGLGAGWIVLQSAGNMDCVRNSTNPGYFDSCQFNGMVIDNTSATPPRRIVLSGSLVTRAKSPTSVELIGRNLTVAYSGSRNDTLTVSNFYCQNIFTWPAPPQTTTLDYTSSTLGGSFKSIRMSNSGGGEHIMTVQGTNKVVFDLLAAPPTYVLDNIQPALPIP